MRKKLVVGNWKMNKMRADARALIQAIVAADPAGGRAEVVLCPPFVFVDMAVTVTRGTGVLVGAQNAFHEPGGAFTGEVSAPMLKDLGCAYVILGHSERRIYFHEKDADINRKVRRCVESGLKPIYCVGETLAQRRAGAAFDVLNEQLVYGLEGIDDGRLQEMVIAYEPVWAIGTGMSATSGQAQEVHRFIRGVLGRFSGGETADRVRIIYGGSVTPDNAASLMLQADIDGALVGGASLSAESFRGIIQAAGEAAEKGAN
jgi:triosephosphate isomerase